MCVAVDSYSLVGLRGLQVMVESFSSIVATTRGIAARGNVPVSLEDRLARCNAVYVDKHTSGREMRARVLIHCGCHRFDEFLDAQPAVAELCLRRGKAGGGGVGSQLRPLAKRVQRRLEQVLMEDKGGQQF